MFLSGAQHTFRTPLTSRDVLLQCMIILQPCHCADLKMSSVMDHSENICAADEPLHDLQEIVCCYDVNVCTDRENVTLIQALPLCK